MTDTHDVKAFTLADCKQCIVSWNYWNGTIIDFINPTTGRTVIYDKSLEDVQVQHPDAEILTFGEYSAKKAAMQRTSIAWLDSTEESYYYSLECLPPAYQGHGGFLVGEAYDHAADTGEPMFTAFRKVGSQFFMANRPLTIREFKAEVLQVMQELV